MKINEELNTEQTPSTEEIRNGKEEVLKQQLGKEDVDLSQVSDDLLDNLITDEADSLETAAETAIGAEKDALKNVSEEDLEKILGKAGSMQEKIEDITECMKLVNGSEADLAEALLRHTDLKLEEAKEIAHDKLVESEKLDLDALLEAVDQLCEATIHDAFEDRSIQPEATHLTMTDTDAEVKKDDKPQEDLANQKGESIKESQIKKYKENNLNNTLDDAKADIKKAQKDNNFLDTTAVADDLASATHKINKAQMIASLSEKASEKVEE